MPRKRKTTGDDLEQYRGKPVVVVWRDHFVLDTLVNLKQARSISTEERSRLHVVTGLLVDLDERFLCISPIWAAPTMPDKQLLTVWFVLRNLGRL